MPLTHQWKFNGNLKDSIGTLDFLNLRNLAGFTTGVVQQSLNFPNGYHGPLTSGIVTQSNPFPSTPNAPWTIAFWIKNVVEDTFLYLSGSGKIRLFFKRSTIDDAFIVGFDNDNYSGTAIEKLGTNSKSSVFTHYAIVYTSDNILPKLYINGIEQLYYPDGTTPDPNLLDFVQLFGTENISKSINTLVISNNQNGYQFDDLRIYDEALSTAQINEIYNSICSEITQETQLVITTQPTATYTNVKLGTSVVHVRNASNTTVTSSNLQVTAEIYTGTGNLVGTTSVQAINGVATFSNLRIDTVGTFTLRYTNPCLTPAISSSISPTEFLASLNNNLTLFIKNNEFNNLTLFIKGHGEHVEVLPLYVEASFNENLNLYLISRPMRVAVKNLYIKSSIFENVELFTTGYLRRYRPLFFYVKANPSNSTDLFIASSTGQSLNMFVLSNVNSTQELFLKQSPQKNADLYIAAPIYPSDISSTYLYMQGDDAIRYYYNEVNLFIRNYLYEGTPLYMEVPSIGVLNTSVSLHTIFTEIIEYSNSSMDMFLFNDTKGLSLSMNTYIQGKGIAFGYYPSDSNISMFMARDIEYQANSLNMHTYGNELINSNINMSIFGNIIENTTLNLSIPNTNDISEQFMNLSILGYNPWRKYFDVKTLFLKTDSTTTTTTTVAP